MVLYTVESSSPSGSHRRSRSQSSNLTTSPKQNRRSPRGRSCGRPLSSVTMADNKWDVESWRRGKRFKQADSLVSSPDSMSGIQTDEQTRLAPSYGPFAVTSDPLPSASLPSTSSAFNFFPQRSNSPRTSSQSPRALLEHGPDENNMQALQAEAFRDLHRSIIQADESLVDQMRAWESQQSNRSNADSASVCTRTDLDGDIELSGVEYDDDASSLPHLSMSMSTSAASSALSLPWLPMSRTPTNAHPPMPRTNSEKAMAAIALAIANGAGSVQDYQALVDAHKNAIDDMHAGELWN